MCPLYSVTQNGAKMHQNTLFLPTKIQKKILERGLSLLPRPFPWWGGDTSSYISPLKCLSLYIQILATPLLGLLFPSNLDGD